MTRGGPRLASRLMLAQGLVIVVGTLALIVTALVVAPGLFHWHLMHAGVQQPMVQQHAEEAFASAFVISAAVGTVVALVAAGLVSWFLVRRISKPVEELAQAAESVASGHYRVDVPSAAFSAELSGLAASFLHMADRLADMDVNRSRLLADLAHELRTPLATLEAYIDGLEDHVLKPTPESWATMRTQVERLRRLAADVRDAAEAEEHALGLVFEPLDMNAVTAAAVAAATPGFQAKGVRLHATMSGEGPAPVRGDSIRLQQVLANLLENALRHTPSTGAVEVTVAAVDQRVLCTVVDDGEGIDPSELAYIFDRFHRADPARSSGDGSGSGLGLTIARAIVIDHGGTLRAASDGLGRGTTFTIDLPAAS